MSSSGPIEEPVRTTVKSAVPAPGRTSPSPHATSVQLPGTPYADHTPLLRSSSDANKESQASACNSSVSSEVSVKSTDVLLTLGKNC